MIKFNQAKVIGPALKGTLLVLGLFFFNVRAMAVLQVTATGTNASCAGNASVQVHTTGGTAPYSFTLLNSANTVIRPAQTDSLFLNLPPGTYKAAVNDALNTTTPINSNVVTVTSSYSGMNITSALGSTTSAYACVVNQNAGTVSVTLNNGKPPFTYAVTSGPVIPPNIVSSLRSVIFTGLSSGSYVVSIVDSCGNTVSSGSISVLGTNQLYPSNILALVQTPNFNQSNNSTCNPRISQTFSGNVSSVRWYIEYPAGSGVFTDTFISSQLALLPYLNPTLLQGQNYNTWYQHPCTGAWVLQTRPIPSTIPMTPGLYSFSYFTIPTNCDSIVPMISPNFNASPVFYCYPIRITIADTLSPNVLLEDTTVVSGTLFGANFPVPGSGTYWVTLTDAQGATYRKAVVVAASAPLRISTGNVQYSSCDQSTVSLAVTNVATGSANFPITFNAVSLPGGASVAGLPPIVVNSSPGANLYIPLWTNIPVAISGNMAVEVVFSCRRDTFNVAVNKFRYAAAKFDSAQLSIGSSGCSAGRANVGLFLHITDTSGNQTNLTPSSNPNLPFFMRYLPNGSTIFMNGSSGSLVLSNILPGTYKLGIAPNTPVYNSGSTTPSPCLYWDTITIVVPNLGSPVIDASKTFGMICSGDVNGKLLVVANGYPPFQYRIKPSASSTYGTYQSSNLFTGLIAGSYDVQVMDGCNAVTSQTASVQESANAAFINVTGAPGNIAPANGNIALQFGAFGTFVNVQWTKPNGTIVDSVNIHVSNFQQADSGRYLVTATSGVGCALMDSVTIGYNNVVLPLNLLSFTGQRKERNDLLSWNTAGEINTDHFEIEYSTDAIRFATIGSVKCKAENKPEHSYSYTNEDISGTAWYRLRLTDRSGSYTYSKVITIRNQGACGTAGFNISEPFPVPFKNEISVHYCSENETQAAIRLVNVLGEEVYHTRLMLPPGQGLFTLKIPGFLASGSYFLEVVTPNGSRQQLRLLK